MDPAGDRGRVHALRLLGPMFDRIGLGCIAHRGYGIDRLVGTLYMTLEGIFGVPLDVTATYIILFTIYGAVLELIRRRHLLHRLVAGGDGTFRRRGARPHGDGRRAFCSAPSRAAAWRRP